MRLDDGWNQIQFNLADFTRRAYGTNYIETLKVQIHANCRLRRVYFSDRLYSEEEMPQEYRLFVPTAQAPSSGLGAPGAASHTKSVSLVKRVVAKKTAPALAAAAAMPPMTVSDPHGFEPTVLAEPAGDESPQVD